MKTAINCAIVALLAFLGLVAAAFGQAVQVPAKMIGATLVYEVIDPRVPSTNPSYRKVVEYVLGSPVNREMLYTDIAYAYHDASRPFPTQFVGRFGGISYPVHTQTSVTTEHGGRIKRVLNYQAHASTAHVNVNGQWHDTVTVVDGIVTARSVYNISVSPHYVEIRLLRVEPKDATTDGSVQSAGR
ncbi:MAG: hypothetical protein ACKVQQ_24170 [Burkholderiales bacterium]